MEVRFYTRELDLIGIMENQTSILWRRKFYEPGTFEIYAPITEYNAGLCKLENLVQIEGAVEAGVIEEVLFQQENYYNKIRISGRFMSSYLDRRVIMPRITFTGRTELAMRQLVENIAFPLPRLRLGALQGFTETVSFQATYKNVLTYMTKLSKSSNIGFRFRPDFTGKTITLEMYKGEDHSAGQSDRTRIVFSEEYQNVNSAKWLVNQQLKKNLAFVGGEGEGVDRWIVWAWVLDNGERGEWDLTYLNNMHGLDRREMFVDARDIQMGEMDNNQYIKSLRERGFQKLKEASLATSLECTVTPIGNFIYRRDYDLGDVVTVRKESWGVSEDKRITELLEVYENGTTLVTPTLGTTLPETIDWSEQNG